MDKRIGITLLVAAALMGTVSPFMSGPFAPLGDEPTSRGLGYAWFYAGPIAAEQLFLLEGDFELLCLSITVYTLQYLAAITILRSCLPLTAVVRDFFRPYRHRTGLIQRQL